MQNITPLSVIDGKSLLALDVEPVKFIVSGLMPTGLHMLAGSPKIGKSWLALWLCDQVAKGEKVWEFDTLKCATLYLALEDTVDRLSIRLSRITETGSEQNFFATEAENLSGALIEQLERFMRDYPDTGLIVIDTFQRIRDMTNDKSSYAIDYEEISKIKAVADKYRIAILLVHHLRKMPDSDPFNMVSGSTGIIGAVDSVYVLEKEKRTDNKAKLHVTGRDIRDMQLLLELDRDTSVWRFISDLTNAERPDDKYLAAVLLFFSVNKTFNGTMTELAEALKKDSPGMTLQPNALSRLLRENDLKLKAEGINIGYRKIKGVKFVRVVTKGGNVPTDGEQISLSKSPGGR